MVRWSSVMSIGQVATKPVVSTTPNAPLAEVAKLLTQRHVGAIVVVKRPADRVEAVGIITDRDIVKAVSGRAADLYTLSAEEVMSRDVLEINESDSLAEGIRRMRARGVRRAPVIDSSGALVGVVSVDDLLYELTRELASIVDLIKRQPLAEGTVRT
jgi:CBS domain-containing protein